MKTKLVCVVLLFVGGCAVSSDAGEDGKGATREFMNSLLTSKVSGQNMANWRVMLLNFCGLLHSQREENINKEAPALEGLYSIHSLCWTLHPTRRNDQSASGYLDLQYAENNKNVLKKKSPYILKRHLYAGKARRPYILKRSLDY